MQAFLVQRWGVKDFLRVRVCRVKGLGHGDENNCSLKTGSIPPTVLLDNPNSQDIYETQAGLGQLNLHFL